MRRRRKPDPERRHREAVRAAMASGSDSGCDCGACLAMRGETTAAPGPPPAFPAPRRPIARRRERERRGAHIDRALLQATRLMGCAFCLKRAPVSAHHFPPKSVMGATDDRLACPACGDGVRGCHGRAQRYEIPADDQVAAVARTLLEHVLAGRLSLASAREAAERVPRLDWRAAIHSVIAGHGGRVVEPRL